MASKSDFFKQVSESLQPSLCWFTWYDVYIFPDASLSLSGTIWQVGEHSSRDHSGRGHQPPNRKFNKQFFSTWSRLSSLHFARCSIACCNSSAEFVFYCIIYSRQCGSTICNVQLQVFTWKGKRDSLIHSPVFDTDVFNVIGAACHKQILNSTVCTM